MLIFKAMYQNKNLYLLVMIVLLGVIAVLDSFELSSLLISILLFTLYGFLILRYKFLKYSIVFLVFISLLCLKSVFFEEFITLLSGLENKAVIEHYLLYQGAEITTGIIFILIIWSLLSKQRTKQIK